MAALAFLHENKLIHADIKPDNVLLCTDDTSSCRLKLADFSNAIEDREEVLRAYLEEFELQTLWYRAPEVIVGVPFGTSRITRAWLPAGLSFFPGVQLSLTVTPPLPPRPRCRHVVNRLPFG